MTLNALFYVAVGNFARNIVVELASGNGCRVNVRLIGLNLCAYRGLNFVFVAYVVCYDIADNLDTVFFSFCAESRKVCLCAEP